SWANTGSPTGSRACHAGPCDPARTTAMRSLFHAVALAEFLDLAGGVQNVLLAGVERVGRAADFQLDQRVFVTVFPFDGLIGLDGGARQKSEVATHVLENDRAIFGVNVLFHAALSA